MGACRVAALAVLLLAAALLPGAASSRVLEGEASSGKGAPAPTGAAGGSAKTESPKESGQSSSAGQQAESKAHTEAAPPTTAAKDPKQPSTGEGAKKGQEGAGSQTSVASPPPPPTVQDEQKASPPPPPVKESGVQKENPPPPPGGSGQNDGGEATGGTDHEDTGNKGKDDATEKLKEVMEKCDASRKCSAGEEFSACLQVSNDAAIRSFVVVLNKGQNAITVNVKEASNIDIDKKPLHLPKGAYKKMAVKNISPGSGEITLNDGHGNCTIHINQPVSDWQQQFQQFAAYATSLNPIYGAYLFGFTVVLVGVVCLCCKFVRKRGNGGVPYQQLEMSAPAPNSSGANNSTSTADGWDDGWDDDWDDEEAAPARPSDKKPASSVSANGLSLRSRTDNKDGWDVDWDD